MKLLLLLLSFVSLALACDLTVHVKSATQKRFYVQVTTPNGHKSQRWVFGRNREQETYRQNANECIQGDWVLECFNDSGVVVNTVRVNLDGIGSVTYEVNDDLALVQVSRQGAICNGQCAALGTNNGNVGGVGRSNSRTISGINH